MLKQEAKKNTNIFDTIQVLHALVNLFLYQIDIGVCASSKSRQRRSGHITQDASNSYRLPLKFFDIYELSNFILD